MAPLRHLEVPDTAPLFAPLHGELLTLLRGLSPEDWARPTVAGAWRVRDVAMHLLDGDFRKLSAHRDAHLLTPDNPIEGYADVLALINGLNASGVAYGRRLSPRLVTDLLDVTGRWVSDFVATLDPAAPALFGVEWAGESKSDNRLDTAREYTERWHHQMQIRSALAGADSREALRAPRYLTPLLDTSVRALPHAYRSVDAAEGTAIVLAQRDGDWVRTLRREGSRWVLYHGAADGVAARVTASGDTLWRHFFNAIPAAEAQQAFEMQGNTELLASFRSVRSVMV